MNNLGFIKYQNTYINPNYIKQINEVTPDCCRIIMENQNAKLALYSDDSSIPTFQEGYHIAANAKKTADSAIKAMSENKIIDILA